MNGVFLSQNEAMKFIGKTNLHSFHAWRKTHGINPDHCVGRYQYFLKAEILLALQPRPLSPSVQVKRIFGN